MAISTVTAVTNAAQTLGNLILVTPQNTIGYQPQNQVGSTYNAPALLFHYEGENKSSFESDITDNYVEDNTAIQDQIALKPVIIVTQGFVGELNDIPPNKAFQIAQVAAQKLVTISAYTPSLSTTALLAYNEAVFAYSTLANVAQNAVSAWSSIVNGGVGTTVISGNSVAVQPSQNKQQTYYQQFYGYWNSRTLFTIQTPWAIFTDMAILKLDAVQSAETNVISEFTVTFKQMRFAKVQTADSDYTNNTNFQGRLQQQAAPTTNLGTNSLSTSSTDLNSALTSGSVS